MDSIEAMDRTFEKGIVSLKIWIDKSVKNKDEHLQKQVSLLQETECSANSELKHLRWSRWVLGTTIPRLWFFETFPIIPKFWENFVPFLSGNWSSSMRHQWFRLSICNSSCSETAFSDFPLDCKWMDLQVGTFLSRTQTFLLFRAITGDCVYYLNRSELRNPLCWFSRRWQRSRPSNSAHFSFQSRPLWRQKKTDQQMKQTVLSTPIVKSIRRRKATDFNGWDIAREPSIRHGDQSTNTATDNFKNQEEYGDDEDHTGMSVFLSSGTPKGLSWSGEQQWKDQREPHDTLWIQRCPCGIGHYLTYKVPNVPLCQCLRLLRSPWRSQVKCDSCLMFMNKDLYWGECLNIQRWKCGRCRTSIRCWDAFQIHKWENLECNRTLFC
jgi:hypothetical protein